VGKKYFSAAKTGIKYLAYAGKPTTSYGRRLRKKKGVVGVARGNCWLGKSCGDEWGAFQRRKKKKKSFFFEPTMLGQKLWSLEGPKSIARAH
jgi:hypothetical protein